MKIRRLKKSDISVVVDSFAQSGWTEKPARIFEQYLEEQSKGERTCWAAFVEDQFAGYVTLKWQSAYPYFAKAKIPEIADLNVLPAFRNQGIGTALIEQCEKLAAKKSDFVGIGVGLYPDYGPAQRLYIKRDYVPDGQGSTYDYQPIVPGEQYPMDDNLILWFTKCLFESSFSGNIVSLGGNLYKHFV